MRPVGRPATDRSSTRALRSVVVLVLLAAVGYLGISWKYADGVTRVTRDPLKKTPAYVQRAYIDVSFKSPRRPDPEGLVVPAPGIVAATKAALMVHGKDQNRIDSSFDPGRIARALLADGSSVLVFEMRGPGESEGLAGASPSTSRTTSSARSISPRSGERAAQTGGDDRRIDGWRQRPHDRGPRSVDRGGGHGLGVRIRAGGRGRGRAAVLRPARVLHAGSRPDVPRRVRHRTSAAASRPTSSARIPGARSPSSSAWTITRLRCTTACI
jgi:hypothetical protein